MIVMGSTQVLNGDISNQLTDKTYKQILEINFSKFRNCKLDKRLQKMMSCWDGNCFLTLSHRHRFLSYCRETFSNQNCAALYLPSADEILWYRAYSHILQMRFQYSVFRFKESVQTDMPYTKRQRPLLQKKHIYMNEIADEKLIGDFAFKAIIIGMLLARYGTDILNFGQEK